MQVELQEKRRKMSESQHPMLRSKMLDVLNTEELWRLISQFVVQNVEKQIVFDTHIDNCIKYLCIESKMKVEWRIQSTSVIGACNIDHYISFSTAPALVTIGETVEYRPTFPWMPKEDPQVARNFLLDTKKRINGRTARVNKENGDIVFVAKTSRCNQELGEWEYSYYLCYYDASRKTELEAVKLPSTAYLYWPRLCLAKTSRTVYIQSNDSIGWVDFDSDGPVFQSVFEKGHVPLPEGTLRCNDPNRYVSLLLHGHYLVAVRLGGTLDCFRIAGDKMPLFDHERLLSVPGVDYDKKKLSIHGNKITFSSLFSLVTTATISVKEDLASGFLREPENVLILASLPFGSNAKDAVSFTRKLDHASPLTAPEHGIYAAGGIHGLIKFSYNLDEPPQTVFAHNRSTVCDVRMLHGHPFIIVTGQQRADVGRFMPPTYRLIKVTGNNDNDHKQAIILRNFCRPTFL